MESENHTPDTSRVYGILPMFICTSASNERSSQLSCEVGNTKLTSSNERTISSMDKYTKNQFKV